MTAFKSLEGTGDDYIFKICANTDNSCASIKLKANGLAEFAQRIKLYDTIPADKLGDETYILSRLDRDNRMNRINISLPDSRGNVKLTLTSIYFDKLTKAGCRIEFPRSKKIFHNGTPTEVTKVSSILQLNRFTASEVNTNVAQLETVAFLTVKDSPLLADLGVLEIYLPVTDTDFAMVVQALSEKRVPYQMDYNGLKVSGLGAILEVIKLGGKFTGSEEIVAMAGINRAA